MAFPAIRHCLLCEDFRPEINRKSTIAGFYGITPHATILVRELEKPIGRLLFLLLLEESEDTKEYKLTPRLIGPDDEKIVDALNLDVKLSKGSALQLAFVMMGVTFRRAGRHTLSLLIDGKEHYRTEFAVLQGVAENFDDEQVVDRGPIGSDETKTGASPDLKATPTTAAGDAALSPDRADQRK